MIVAATQTAAFDLIQRGFRTSRRGLVAPIFAPGALAAGHLVRDGEGFRLASGAALPGVSLDGDGNGGHVLRFARERYDSELAQLVALHLSGADFQGGPGASGGVVVSEAATEDVPLAADLGDDDGWTGGYPTDEDLRLIRKNHSLDTAVSRDDLFVFTRWVANDALSRSGWLRLTKEALAKGAQDLAAGRAVCLHHDKRLVFGRTFAARVVRRTREGLSARWIEVKGYAPRRDSNQDTRQDIELGVLACDSVTFGGGDVSLVEETVAVSSKPGAAKVKRSFMQVTHDDESPSPFRIAETSLVFFGELHGAGNEKLKARTGDGTAPEAAPPASSGADGNPSGGSKDDRNPVVVFLP